MGCPCGTRGERSRRMLKKAVHQGRSKRRDEAYAWVRWASERRENAAGGFSSIRLETSETGDGGLI